MKRTIEVVLSDGSTYILSERARIYSNVSYLKDKFRKHNLKMIQEVIPGEEMQLSMLMSEMKRNYTERDLIEFQSGNVDLLYDMIFYSLVITYPTITITRVMELVPDYEVEAICNKIHILEDGDSAGAEKKKRKAIPKTAVP